MNKQIEIAIFCNSDGPMSKHFALQDGKIQAVAACKLKRGTARRVMLYDAAAFAKLIGNMKSNEALALGRLRADLPDTVEVVTKRELNGSTAVKVIARSQDFLYFAERIAAWMLFDHDGKKMPSEVADKLNQLGGCWAAILSVAPQLASAARVVRASTSAGLYNKETGEQFAGSSNQHIYVAVADGNDIERALKDLHDRLWLAGFGYVAVGEIGQLLAYSIVDKSVYGPERLVFEGAPLVEPPLAQDAKVRRPQLHEGMVIDTLQAIPPLSEEETRQVSQMKAEAKRILKPAAAAKRKAWAEEFAKRRGLSEQEAERIASAAADQYVLAAEFELEFDDDELGLRTVADVLADPESFIGQSLADPLEGLGYGRTRAMVLKRQNGTLFINSFAHGGIKYELAGQGVSMDSFYSLMPEHQHKYIFKPVGERWPASSVNARIPPVAVVDAKGNPVYDKKGNQKFTPANQWLDQNRAVEQMTWMPGAATLIEDFLVAQGGWKRHNGARIFNLYHPPTLPLGDPEQAGPWLDLVHKIYPETTDHVIKWLAHRVQRPGEKINHALVLSGQQGIGKDTIIEPVKRAVGSWNFGEVKPQHMLGNPFNDYAKSIILRVNEAHDLGEFDRFKLHHHLKDYCAAPPDVLRVNEKNTKQYYIANVCGVIITTNDQTTGLYIPPDDRRHHVSGSKVKKEDFAEDYWNKMWRWLDNGGASHVAAYLMQLDISAFDAKAAPPKTEAWWGIVNANSAPENIELANILDTLNWPDAVPLPDIKQTAHGPIREWLEDPKNSRLIPHRLKDCDYEPVRNEDDKTNGLWKRGGKRFAIYAKSSLTLQQQRQAVEKMFAMWDEKITRLRPRPTTNR